MRDSRNPSTKVKGVASLSRTQSFKLRALHKRKSSKTTAPTKSTTTSNNIAAGWKYPGDDVPHPKPTRKSHSTPVLRASLTPGTIVILLAGRYRGKKAVLLKQLDSGLLLVTGPHALNGVPLRRVNPAYVIATKTKVALGGAAINAKFNDAYFAKAPRVQKSMETVLQESTVKKTVSAERSADQKSVDKALVASIKKVSMLKSYMKTPFALSKGEFPHAMVF